MVAFKCGGSCALRHACDVCVSKRRVVYTVDVSAYTLDVCMQHAGSTYAMVAAAILLASIDFLLVFAGSDVCTGMMGPEPHATCI